MKQPPMPQAEAPRATRAAVLLCGLGIVAAVAAAYCTSLGGAFLYDDIDSILTNTSIRHLATALRPPLGETVSGRPLVNLSLALNYAVSGTGVWSYHALNVAIHAAAALLLFGVVRRTLAGPAAGERQRRDGLWLALAAALLWAVHPLQTESVAYVIQRAESLMGLFYLLMLYGFIRLASAGAWAPAWAAVSVAACLLGMASKEVMATAPLMVLLYDRCFVGGSFAEAWRRRRALYLAYAACWLPLATFIAGTGGRGGTVGFGSGLPWWAYAMMQFKAIAVYLRLCLWPRHLVGDYGRILEGDWLEVALCAVLVLSLVAATLALLRRRSPLGFVGAWFLVILAPSSSVIPVATEIMAEHRVYLSLAAVTTLLALALGAVLSRRPFLACVGLAALGLALLTARRTRVYRDGFSFWTDVVLKAPANAGGWNNLGNILAERGDNAGAVADYSRAIERAPEYAYAHSNVGKALVALGRVPEAVGHYREALRFRPRDPSIHYSLALALSLEKRDADAAAEYRETLKLDPGRVEAWLKLADALVAAGDLAGGEDAYAHAVRLRPASTDARVNHGNVLAQLGRFAEALGEFKEALRLEPEAADIHNNLGSLLAEGGMLAEARAQFEEALRLKPDYDEARANLRRLDALQRGGAPQ